MVPHVFSVYRLPAIRQALPDALFAVLRHWAKIRGAETHGRERDDLGSTELPVGTQYFGFFSICLVLLVVLFYFFFRVCCSCVCFFFCSEFLIFHVLKWLFHYFFPSEGSSKLKFVVFLFFPRFLGLSHSPTTGVTLRRVKLMGPVSFFFKSQPPVASVFLFGFHFKMKGYPKARSRIVPTFTVSLVRGGFHDLLKYTTQKGIPLFSPLYWRT